ncbi:PAS domain S-box protein [Myxococcota bacterium]|nr:PAS domain S-box protein [Myxococcota bacterium]
MSQLPAQPHLEAIFTSSRDAIGVSRNGEHVAVNPAYVALFGYSSADELVGRSILELIAPSDRARVIENVRRRSSGLSVAPTYVTRGLRRDGTEFDMEVHGSHYLHRGELHTVVTLRDVTTRVEMERALRESQELFLALSQQTLLGIVILQDDHVVYANDATAKICEYSVAEMLAWKAGDFAVVLHPDDRAFAFEQAQKKQRGDKDVVVRYSYRLVAKSGRIRTVEQYSHTISFRGRHADLVMFIDIDDRVAIEREKQRLEGQLRQAQKMEAVGRLAGGIAHDFNNLLTAIIGNVALALSSATIGDDVRELLGEVERAAESAAGLTRQLLAFSRKQVIEPRDVVVDEVVHRMQRMLGRVLGENVHLVSHVEPNLPTIRVDLVQLEQVILNLALNARDAMPDGGTLTLAASRVVRTEAECALRPELSPGTFVCLSVTDTGHGMSDEVKQHLFEPFFTTKQKGKGTGLGLATVFGAVTQHGGAIDVVSEVGRGTTVHVSFPTSPSEGTNTGDLVRAVAAPTGQETILVVEDEPVVRALAVRILTRLGYAVLSAEDGPRALAIARSHKAQIDLLVTDVIMPGMNGREVAEQLTAERRTLKVLYTSGYTDDVIVRQGVLDAGLDFLGKPYGPAALGKKVRELLDRQR